MTGLDKIKDDPNPHGGSDAMIDERTAERLAVNDARINGIEQTQTRIFIYIGSIGAIVVTVTALFVTIMVYVMNAQFEAVHKDIQDVRTDLLVEFDGKIVRAKTEMLGALNLVKQSIRDHSHRPLYELREGRSGQSPQPSREGTTPPPG